MNRRSFLLGTTALVASPALPAIETLAPSALSLTTTSLATAKTISYTASDFMVWARYAEKSWIVDFPETLSGTFMGDQPAPEAMAT